MKGLIYIPTSETAARRHLDRALSGKLAELPKAVFMRAYCALAFLYPGFHPDEFEDWEGPAEAILMAKEAWRRAGTGELNDNELYPYQATKARIRLMRRSTKE